MTLRSRRTLAIVGVGALLLAAVTIARDNGPGDTTARLTRRDATRAATPDNVPVADVKLELLQGTRPELEKAERNLFRFQAKSAPAISRPRAQPTVSAPTVPPVPLQFGPAPGVTVR